MLTKGQIFGNSFIGVFSSANEFLAVLPSGDENDKLSDVVKKTLEIEEAIRLSVDGSNILGALLVMNSNGALVSPFIRESEYELLNAHIPVHRLPEKLNAAGNNILANDNGALVHPSFNDKGLALISKALGVPVRKGRIAGFKTVGSAAVATNKAAICHPHASDWERERIEEILQVDVSICTANYGSGLLGASVIANTRGAIVGEQSTPIELGKVEEGLRLY
jgi:translation initiation factor 6